MRSGEKPVEYRRATIHDMEALACHREQQLIDEGFPPLQYIHDALLLYFHEGLTNNTFVAWLAVDEGRIVATSGLCFYQLPPTYANPSGMVAYVTNMFTLKSHRRKGIATVLLEKVIAEARAMGFSIVRLHASADGKALYKKFGFADSGGYMNLAL